MPSRKSEFGCWKIKAHRFGLFEKQNYAKPAESVQIVEMPTILINKLLQIGGWEISGGVRTAVCANAFAGAPVGQQ